MPYSLESEVIKTFIVAVCNDRCISTLDEGNPTTVSELLKTVKNTTSIEQANM